MTDETHLSTEDGVRISAAHDRPQTTSDTAIVLVHGFTGSWRRPAVRRIARVLTAYAGVIALDLRGHGTSGGGSTLGDKEILDVAAAVTWARELGYHRITTLGFSLGSSVVLRHAGLFKEIDAVAAVSGPARWYYRGTVPMRRVHWVVERRLGRFVGRHVLKVRIDGRGWAELPIMPSEAAARIAPTPLLIVHGDADPYFPIGHARALAEAAPNAELWIEPGMGHAENSTDDALAARLGKWLTTAAEPPGRATAESDIGPERV